MDDDGKTVDTVYVLAFGNMLLGAYASVQGAEDGYLEYRNSCMNPQKLFCDWETKDENTQVCMDDMAILAGNAECYPTISRMTVKGEIAG